MEYTNLNNACANFKFWQKFAVCKKYVISEFGQTNRKCVLLSHIQHHHVSSFHMICVNGFFMHQDNANKPYFFHLALVHGMRFMCICMWVNDVLLRSDVPHGTGYNYFISWPNWFSITWEKGYECFEWTV